MSVGGGPDDDWSQAREQGGARDRPEAPPWERPGLPAWLSAATAVPAPPPAERRRSRGLLIAVLTVVVAMLAGVGTVVAIRRAGPVTPDGGSTNALGSATGATGPSAGTPTSSTTAPAPLVAPRTEAEIRARIDRIEQELTRVRGLAFKRKVPAELLPAAK